MDEQQLEIELKELIIDCLALEDMSPDDIASDMVLFGDGLGLDSVDALELGMALQKKYQIEVKAEDESTREHFSTVQNLAKLVARNNSNGATS